MMRLLVRTLVALAYLVSAITSQAGFVINSYRLGFPTPATFIGADDANTAVAIALPAHNAGDLIIVFGFGITLPTIANGGTWNVLSGGDLTVTYLTRAWYKIADPGQANPTVTTTSGGAVAFIYRGATVPTVVGSDGGQTADLVMPGVTPAGNSVKLLTISSDRNSSAVLTPSGFTDRHDGTITNFGVDLFDIDPVSYVPGSSVTLNFPTNSNEKHGLFIELTP